eukprot:5574817-Ditylum_brightwellii.AAC.1
MPPLLRRSDEDDSSDDEDIEEEQYQDMPLFVLRNVAEYNSSASEYDSSDDECTASTVDLTEEDDNGCPATQEEYD